MENHFHNPLLEKVFYFNNAIFIPENVPSSKNSRRCIKGMLFPSKAVETYRAVTSPIWNNEIVKQKFKSLLPKNPPYFIGFHFIKSTNHKFDFINPLQTIQDLMVKSKWIEDDNTSIILPVPLLYKGSYFSKDKENPGVIIKPLKLLKHDERIFSIFPKDSGNTSSKNRSKNMGRI